MSTYTIGEIAERSGFSASSLRYYEGIGLVVPPARSEAGYRLYDDRSLARLAFIARAKQLGCSLEEIADLVSIWEGERCGPVQGRFHELVTAKLGDANRQIAELAALVGQLEHAAEQLAGPAVDGPCGQGCACLGGRRAAAPTAPVASIPEPTGTPIACSLESTAVPARLAEWQGLLSVARRRVGIDGGLRIEFDPRFDPTELARLVAAEQQCCAFFTFAITVDGRGVGLEVRAPEEAAHLVDSLFAHAT